MGKKVEDGEANSDNEKGDDGKNGKPFTYDPAFKGPIENRGCTDVICCLLFVICFLGMAVVGYFAYHQGDPVRLIYPSDSESNLCGYGSYSMKPNLFFFDLLDCAKVGVGVVNGCPTTQVCVESCPGDYWTWYSNYAAELVADTIPGKPGLGAEMKKRKTTMYPYCKYSVLNDPTAADKKSVKKLVEDDDCPAYYTKMEPLVGRCIPSIFKTLVDKAAALATSGNNTEQLRDKFGNNVTGSALEKGTEYLAYFLNAKEYGEKFLADVRASWWLILIGLGVACIIAFLWIIIMRWIAGIMVWFTIFAFIALFGFCCYYTFTKYYALKDTADTTSLVFTTSLSYYTNLKETWLALGIISAVILGIILLLVLFLRERILIAVSLIKEASRAVGNMVFTLLFPLIPFMLQIVLFAYWGATAIFLASSDIKIYTGGNGTANTTEASNSSTSSSSTNLLEQIPCDPNANSTLGTICSFAKYGDPQYTIYLQFYMLFMLFWVMNFIIALGQMALAGAFASYYWAFTKPDDIPAFPLSASLWRCFRYHLGSLAFGSLIIAIIQIIRVILEYVDHKLKGSENQVAKFFLKCLKCFFWCLEKFMKFLNKNAYILVAVYGKNFCTSAKNAFFLILRNVVRVAVVDKVTDFVLFISKLVVVAAIGTLAFFFFSGDIPYISDITKNYIPSLHYYLIPVIIITIGSYVIAAGFFSVYSMGVDTLFLCFLEDLERHDGSAEKPYYMNKELKSILGKKNKAEEKGKDKK